MLSLAASVHPGLADTDSGGLQLHRGGQTITKPRRGAVAVFGSVQPRAGQIVPLPTFTPQTFSLSAGLVPGRCCAVVGSVYTASDTRRD